MHQPENVGTVSPSSDTGTTHVTLIKVSCCQLSYVPYNFKHCDLLVLKFIILCITLYSKKPNGTFKIRFRVFTHGLWRVGSSEHIVIPSNLMKRGWKYPLKHQDGGEGTPLKDSYLGALYIHMHTHTKHTMTKTMTKTWQINSRSFCLNTHTHTHTHTQWPKHG